MRRLNHKGHRASIDALISQYRNSAGVQYVVPRALGRRQAVTYSFAVHDDETDAQTSRGGSIGAALAREKGRWETSYGIYLQRQTFQVGADAGTSDLLYPEITWRRIVADDRLQPRAGYRLAIILRGASDQVISDATFAQTDVQTKGLMGAGQHGRLIARADFGAVWSNDFHTLPPSMRYFAGGPQSVRAYGYQDLAPRDSTGQTVGGERSLLASLEYERRIAGGWGAAGFYDIGNALERFGDRLASGAGIGVRWFSPVGMVRLDLAWPIDDPSHRDPHLQFSMGLDL
jgi:translocation and assembly module TamA